MNRKWLPYILMAAMLAAIIVIRQYKKSQEPAPKTRVDNKDRPKDPAGNLTNRDKGFDRRVSFIEYSEHARCRMQCRKISQSDVEAIMKYGEVNYRKSELKNVRCPRYALEGNTPDGQRVRIVFAQCNEKTIVVTAIDLETGYACHCPGDDDKYKNKSR